MRRKFGKLFVAIGVLSAGSLICAPVTQAAGHQMLGGTSTPVLPDTDSGIPTIIPGDALAVACAAISKDNPDSDVRVVLTLAAVVGEDQPGYKKVLATNEQLYDGAVRIRVPEVESLENHTVHVDVYVVDSKGSRSCNAGTIKIV